MPGTGARALQRSGLELPDDAVELSAAEHTGNDGEPIAHALRVPRGAPYIAPHTPMHGLLELLIHARFDVVAVVVDEKGAVVATATHAGFAVIGCAFPKADREPVEAHNAEFAAAASWVDAVRKGERG